MDLWYCPSKKVELSIFLSLLGVYSHWYILDMKLHLKVLVILVCRLLQRCLCWNILGNKNIHANLKPPPSWKDFLNRKSDPSFSHPPLVSLLTTLAPQKPISLWKLQILLSASLCRLPLEETFEIWYQYCPASALQLYKNQTILEPTNSSFPSSGTLEL